MLRWKGRQKHSRDRSTNFGRPWKFLQILTTRKKEKIRIMRESRLRLRNWKVRKQL